MVVCRVLCLLHHALNSSNRLVWLLVVNRYRLLKSVIKFCTAEHQIQSQSILWNANTWKPFTPRLLLYYQKLQYVLIDHSMAIIQKVDMFRVNRQNSSSHWFRDSNDISIEYTKFLRLKADGIYYALKCRYPERNSNPRTPQQQQHIQWPWRPTKTLENASREGLGSTELSGTVGKTYKGLRARFGGCT